MKTFSSIFHGLTNTKIQSLKNHFISRINFEDMSSFRLFTKISIQIKSPIHNTIYIDLPLVFDLFQLNHELILHKSSYQI